MPRKDKVLKGDNLIIPALTAEFIQKYFEEYDEDYRGGSFSKWCRLIGLFAQCFHPTSFSKTFVKQANGQQ